MVKSVKEKGGEGEAISDRVSLFVSGGEVVITTESPEEIVVVDEDAVEITEPVMNYIVFTSESTGNMLTFGSSEYVEMEFYYSTTNDPNLSNWLHVTELDHKISVNFDEQIFIKGKNNSISSCQFSLKNRASVAGHLVALLDYEELDNETSISCSEMFSGCDKLTDASQLILPTVTRRQCYSNMFFGCTSLVNAPLLPATILADYCYASMFSGCSSLVTPPTLPATALCEQCYCQMFKDCSSLVDAPSILAITLARECCSGMFKGCTSLVVAPNLSATSLADDCYSSMFEGCTALTTAPTLPATSLREGSYYDMFKNCSSLSSITCLAVNRIDLGTSTNWLSGVSSSGTLYKSPSASMSIWNTDGSVPSGWTIQDYTE